MMWRRPPSQVLLLPAGLALGHAISFLLVVSPAHRGVWLIGPTEALACVSVPLAAAVLVRAARAGFRDNPAPVRFASLAALQVGAFVVVEAGEHAGGPGRSSVLLTLGLGVIAQTAAAALLCALVHGATAIGRRVRGERVSRHVATPVMSGRQVTRRGWSTIRLLPSHRRGPPLALT